LADKGAKRKPLKLLVASTGGSGAGYLFRFFYHLLSLPGETHWVRSEPFMQVASSELGLAHEGMEEKAVVDTIYKLFSQRDEDDERKEAGVGRGANYSHGTLEREDKPGVEHRFVVYEADNLAAPAASGSAQYDAMVVLPCSMKTLAAAASGLGANLIERAIDVSLKERRKTILMVRETPYNLIHIENMRQITLAGGMVMPVSPGYYRRPSSITDLYDFMCDRLLMQIDPGLRLMPGWSEDLL